MKIQFSFWRKRVRRVLYGAFSLLVISFVGCGEHKEASPGQRTYQVTTQRVTSSKGAEQFHYSGSLEADNTVDLSFSVSGRVANVYVQEGQHITKGTLMATLERNNYQSAFEIAEANFIRAEDLYNRSKTLHARGSLPDRDFITAETGLKQAIANKDIAAKDLADTRLVAPFTGVVTRKIAEIGALAAPGGSAFTLTKTDVMYATAAIAEGDIANIKTNDTVIVDIPALREKRQASVSIVNPQADNYSRTFEVKVKLNNEDGSFLPGMMANLSIFTGAQQNRVTIPTNCILKDVDNIAYVFLAQSDNTAIKKRITLGQATGLGEVVITSGLKAGDRLIVAGYSKLEDGSAIEY